VTQFDAQRTPSFFTALRERKGGTLKVETFNPCPIEMPVKTLQKSPHRPCVANKAKPYQAPLKQALETIGRAETEMLKVELGEKGFILSSNERKIITHSANMRGSMFIRDLPMQRTVVRLG